MYDLTGKRVWVAGHRGMVGSAVVRCLEGEAVDLITATSEQADLRRQDEVEAFVGEHEPEVIILAAARVGGIEANRSAPSGFLYDNAMIGLNVLNAAFRGGVHRVLNLGSSCIYPREASQPIREEALLTGPLEETNEAYAVAKIAVMEYGRHLRREHGVDVISLMPTNLYGPGDNFDLQRGHVLAALLRKAHEAKVRGSGEMTVWGSGRPRREFLHVDDLASAVLHCLQHYGEERHLNVGTGRDIDIASLARLIMDVVGLEAELRFDASKPDGTPRKLLDVERLRGLGWEPTIGLREGIEGTYAWYVANVAS